MPQLQHVTHWEVEASADEVWPALADYDEWPHWWRGIRAVELLRAGDDDAVGSVLRQRWRSRMPFALVFDLEMTHIERPRVIEGRATGDLVGTCRWTLDEDGAATHVRFAVDVRTGRWWMSLPLPFAGRVFRAELETVMRWGREGLARVLGVAVAEVPSPSS